MNKTLKFNRGTLSNAFSPLLLAALCLVGISVTTASAGGLPISDNITIDTTTIGNPGNASDQDFNYGFGQEGAVDYTYNIGTYDVTLTQYTAFLNAVAATDTYNLYNPAMASFLNVAGIAQNGSSGSYSYSVIGSGQHPVTYVSWYDAARFSNWLSNGQPTGLQVAATTEDGAYTLHGASTTGLEVRNANAQYFLPTHDEWYKAAYYDPNKGGPGVGGYWRYPAQSDDAPGNVVGGDANQANTRGLVFSVTQSNDYDPAQNYLTDVGAFTNSASAYGTFDQGGEAFEWTEGLAASSRVALGGSWDRDAIYLNASNVSYANPALEDFYIGFRVGSLAPVPEPSTWAMLVAGAGLLLIAHRRRASSRKASVS